MLRNRYRNNPRFLKEYKGLDALKEKAQSILSTLPDATKTSVSAECEKQEFNLAQYITVEICIQRDKSWGHHHYTKVRNILAGDLKTYENYLNTEAGLGADLAAKR